VQILNPRIEMQVFQIFLILDALSHNNYLVGGCVRDLLLNRTPADYDFVTDVPMDKIVTAFTEAGWKVNVTGQQFLVVSVSKDGEQYEIANFRKDGSYGDGRRPDTVEIGTIEDDANRRDFTINALYLKPGRFTEDMVDALIDPTGKGQTDLYNKVLRFIGKPEDRIREDYLRIFRFYRFATKGFRPEPKSLRACRELFNEAYLKTTPERVRVELEKMI
jgi:tRNA nucleotidyltransferase/poly(A) polymerase